jgi:hypothetical protein
VQLNRLQRAIVSRRFTDLLREVGTLLLAFAPLDYMLQPDLDPWSLLGFVTMGVAFFLLSLVRELRR